MDPIELTAKSLDEGKKLAAERLGVSPDQVEVKVLEETKGLFGRMSYKLSATSTAASSAPAAEAASEAPASEEAPTAVTKPNRARKKPAAAPKDPEIPMQSEINTLETEATPAPSTGSAPRRLGKKVAPASTPEPAASAAAQAPAPSESASEATNEPPATEESKSAPKRLGRGRKSSEEPVAATASTTSPEPAASGAETASAPTSGGRSNRSRDDEGEDDGVVATEAQAEQFRALLQELLATSELAVELRVTGMEGKYVNLAIDDAKSDDPHRADSSYLIGRSGEVLNALQYLANLIGKQQFNDGIRVVLDGAGWREKREAKLQEYTMDVVRQVLEREEEALLDALPAFERRIVHRIVQDIDGVKTYSEGEEPNRRVVISPA